MVPQRQDRDKSSYFIEFCVDVKPFLSLRPDVAFYRMMNFPGVL